MVLIRPPSRSRGLVGGLARASRPFLRGKKRGRPQSPLMSVADALPLPAPPIYARLPVDRALADRSFDAPDNSRAWLEALRADGPRRTDAIADLHELLRAARFEIGRRRAAPVVRPRRGARRPGVQAADDALVAVLAKLDDYRGASRFTTWAYKFALLEAGVRLRRRRQGREVARARAGRRSPTRSRVRSARPRAPTSCASSSARSRRS